MKNIIITVCICLVSISAKAQTILLQETFSNASLPAGWTIDSAGFTPVNKWVFTGLPYPVNGIGFDSGFSNNYVRVYGTGVKRFNCSLNTPIIDASALGAIYLGFSDRIDVDDSISLFNQYAIGRIEVSNDSGLTWTEVYNPSIYHYPVKRNIIDISNIAALHNNVKIRFRYSGYGTGGEWAIDSIVISDSIPCQSPPDSGLTQTNVKYACTGQPVGLSISDLSRGIGQTYQWQLKNNATGNVYTNIAGATTDTLTVTQNGATYYQCLITCGGLTTNSQTKLVSDTPTVGGFYSKNQYMICPGRNDTIAMWPGIPYGGPGVTYQWRSAPSYMVPYTDIPGATNDYYVISNANYTASTFFQCKQICASSGATANISGWNWVNEIINPNPFCYCFPPTGSHCITNNNYLSNVTILNTPFNYTDGCVDTVQFNESTSNYVFHDPVLHPNATAALAPGATYTIEVTNSKAVNLSLWIDYNQDLEFDSISEYTDGGTLIANTPAAFTFTVPANAVNGLTGMRLKTHFFTASLAKKDACAYSNGNTKDYLVTIDSTVSISDVGFGIWDFAVHPNPSKGETTVTSPLPIKSLKVLTVTGSVAFSKENINDYKITLDVKELPHGIYFVEVETEKGMAVKKVVVM